MWPRDPILSVKLMLDMVGVTLCEWRVEEGPNSKCKTEAPCSDRPSLRVDSTSVLSQWHRGLSLSPRMEVISSTSPHDQFGNEAEIQYICIVLTIAFLGDFQAKGNNLLIENLDISCTTNYHTLIFRYFQSVLSVCLFRLYFLNRWSKEFYAENTDTSWPFLVQMPYLT